MLFVNNEGIKRINTNEMLQISIRITASFIRISMSSAVSDNEWTDKTPDRPEAAVYNSALH